MSDHLSLPEGLAQLPPGPGLAAVLAGVDMARLCSSDMYTVAAAQARLVAHEQARLMSTMLTTAYAGFHSDDTPPAGRVELDEFSGDQLAFELNWSRVAVFGHLHLAQDLIERLPDVYDAFSGGRIDLPRARAFAESLALLDVDTARSVAAKVLTQAEDLTPGQVRDRLRYRALRADPGLAKKRLRRSVVNRRVWTHLDPDGTAHLAGEFLPPDQAAAAANRIERLARAAKADGDTRTLPQLRADAMLALLRGIPFTLRPPLDPHTTSADTDTITENTTPTENGTPTDAADDDTTIDLPHPPPTQPAARPSHTEPTPSEPTRPEPSRSEPTQSASDQSEPSRSEPTRSEPSRSASDQSEPAEPEPDEPEFDEPEFDESEPGESESGEPEHRWHAERGWHAESDEPDPGDGYQYSETFDPIGAAGIADDPLPVRTQDGSVDLDRTPSSDQPHLCVCGGVIPAPRRGVVDILVSLTTLAGLNDNPATIPGWGPVTADIARQIANDQDANPQWQWSVVDNNGNLLHHGHTRRRPTAAEQAFVKARDRTCQGKGCRRPAAACDDDHRHEYQHGGPSDRSNLMEACRHHHRLRHERGFTVTETRPGVYQWQAPNKRRYHTTADTNLIHTQDDA